VQRLADARVRSDVEQHGRAVGMVGVARILPSGLDARCSRTAADGQGARAGLPWRRPEVSPAIAWHEHEQVVVVRAEGDPVTWAAARVSCRASLRAAVRFQDPVKARGGRVGPALGR